MSITVKIPEVKGWLERLEAERAKVAQARDSLREALHEMEELEACCSDAFEGIDSAIDRLSELA